MGIREEKNRQAEEYIRRLIASLNSGEALPPIRQMIRESGLGRNVLENSIRKFAAGRMLEPRERSGIYVGTRSQGDSGNVVDIVACSEILYMAPDSAGRFMLELLTQLLAEVVRRGMEPRIHRISYYSPVAEYQRLIENEHIIRAVLLAPHHNDIPRVFEMAGVPHVVVLPRYSPNYGPAVIDAPELVELQLRYLLERGHRRIGFIHTVDSGMLWVTDLLRRECYYRVMGENGIAVRPEWVIHYSLNRDQMFERLDRMFDSPESPTALAVSDWFLGSVYEYMGERRRKIGQDISIISSDGLPMPELNPKPVTVVNSPAKIAALAWDFLTRRCRDDRFQCIDYIDLELSPGASVATMDSPERMQQHDGKRIE